jgi:hypothetical protein
MPPIGELVHIQLEPQGRDLWWWGPRGRKDVTALDLCPIHCKHKCVCVCVYIYVCMYAYITMFSPTVASTGEEKKGEEKGHSPTGQHWSPALFAGVPR